MGEDHGTPESRGPDTTAEVDEPSWWGRRNRLTRVLMVIVVVLGLAMGIEVGYWVSAYRSIDRFELAAAPDDGITTYVLVGSDSRVFVESDRDRESFGASDEVAGERADLVLVVQFGPGDRRAVRSISRDLLIGVPGGGRTRLALMFDDGPQAFADALCHGLGIGVDHMLVVRFDGLRRLVDELGGITVEVPQAMQDPMTGLEVAAGAVVLDGPSALAYARSRTAMVPSPDGWVPERDPVVGRQERSTVVLAAMGSALADHRWPSLAFHSGGRAAMDSVEVSSTTGAWDLIQLGRFIRGMANEEGVVEVVSVRGGQVGEVPLAELDELGRDQLRGMGAYPNRCGHLID